MSQSYRHPRFQPLGENQSDRTEAEMQRKVDVSDGEDPAASEIQVLWLLVFPLLGYMSQWITP